MLLYHGTTATRLNAILRDGLLPRADTGFSNWEVESNALAVYLTNAYAPYYATTTLKEDESKIAIIEIDASLLDYRNLAPDEDFLEQVSRRQSGPDVPPPGMDMRQRNEWFRERLRNYSNYWEKSLERIGNCCHFGRVPRSAITRVLTADVTGNPGFWIFTLDPIISVLNYGTAGIKYRDAIRWLFDGTTPETTALMEQHPEFDKDALRISAFIPPDKRDFFKVETV